MGKKARGPKLQNKVKDLREKISPGSKNNPSQTRRGPRQWNPRMFRPMPGRMGIPAPWGPGVMRPSDPRTMGTQGPMANVNLGAMGCPEYLDQWQSALWLASRNLLRIMRKKQ